MIFSKVSLSLGEEKDASRLPSHIEGCAKIFEKIMEKVRVSVNDCNVYQDI